MDQDLINYISDAEKHGLTEFEIKQNLLDAGWEAEIVEQSFVHAKAAEFKVAQIKDPHVVNVQKPLAGATASEIPAPVELPPQPMPSDKDFINHKTSKIPTALIGAIIVGVMLVLGGSVFAYNKFFSTNPDKTWQTFTQTPQQPIYSNNFDFTYSDSNSTNNSSTPDFFGGLKDLKLEFSGQAYVDTSDKNKINSHSNISYTFSSGNTNFTTGLEYSFSNNIFYLKLGDNPFLKNFAPTNGNNQSVDWIKLDLAKLASSTEGSGDAVFLKQFGDPDFKGQLQQIWLNSKIIKQDKFLSSETISGQKSLHYTNSLDKQALKDLSNKYIDVLHSQKDSLFNSVSDSDITTAKTLIGQLIDKIQIKKFETWIGKNDNQLYKIVFVSNAPSFISLVNHANELDFSSSSGDSKRMADVRQMASTLELFYGDNNGYPDALNGSPVGVTPDYIGMIPTAPAAEGSCTDYFNGYWYKPMGTKTSKNGKNVYSSYQMTFCLGSDYGIYKAGIGKLTPTGIESSVACPSAKTELCINANSTSQDQLIKNRVEKFINDLDFSAEFNITSTYSDYGKKTQVPIPTDAVDILTALNQARSLSRDAKRLADVRMTASALELYYNDKNGYPKQLSLLSPTYEGQIPTAPTPADGSCKPDQNSYSYINTDPQSYALTFCLGQATGGYSAGQHTLTQAGIQ